MAAFWSRFVSASLRRRLAFVISCFVVALPVVVVPAPASAYALPPTTIELPASIYRSIVAAQAIGGSTITAGGLSAGGGSTVGGFGAGAAAAGGVSAGTAAAGVLVALYVGYEIGMWRYTGLAPWESSPGNYSVFIPGGSVPADWCWNPHTLGSAAAPPFSCSNVPDISVYYGSGSNSTWPYAAARARTPWYAGGGVGADPLATTGSTITYFHYYCRGVRYGSSSNSFLPSSSTTGGQTFGYIGGAAVCGGSDMSFSAATDFGWVLTNSGTAPNSASSWYGWGGNLGALTLDNAKRITFTQNYSGKNTALVITNGSYKKNKLRLETYCQGTPLDVWESDWFSTYDTRPDFPKRVCASGRLMTKQVFKTVGQDGSVVVLGTYTAPGAFTDPEVMGRFGDCIKALGTEAACVLRLKRLWPDGDVSTCDIEPSPCAGWWTDTSATTKYRCFWGPYTLSLSECEAYRNSYEPSSTQDQSVTQPTNTGTQVPSTDVNEPPAPQPGSDPWPGITAGLGEGCLPSGWQVLNPFAYAKASACVLRWAFIPKQLAPQLSTLRADFESRPPGSLIATATAGLVAFGQGWSAQTCDGTLPWDFSPVEGKVLRFPCAPPDSTAWTTVYALMTIFVVAAGLWAVWVFGVGAFASRSER